MRTVPGILFSGVFVCGATSQVLSQGSEQWLLSPPNTLVHYTHNMVTTVDGSTVLQSFGDSGSVFTRVDAAGTVLWTRAIGPDQTPLQTGRTPMAPMPDSGVCILLQRPVPLGANTFDFDLVRVAPNGTMLWTKLVALPDSNEIGFNADFGMTANAQGELFVHASLQWASMVVKLTTTGDVIWSRRIWDTSLSAGLDEIIQLVALPDGGCAFLGSGVMGLPGYAVASVGRLDAQGSPLWMNAYNYAVPSTSLSDMFLTLGAGTDLLFSGRLDILGVSNNILVHRIDLNGGLLRSDLYTPPVGNILAKPHVHETGPNDFYIVADRGFLQSAFITHCDAQGSPQESYFAVNDTVAGVRRTILEWHGTPQNGALHMAGEFFTKDLTFGTEGIYPYLWHGAGDLADLCFLEPVVLQHNVVPNGVVQVSAVGTGFVTVGSSVPGTSANTTVVAQSSSSFCAAVVSVPDVEAGRVDPIHPNPALIGGQVFFPSIGAAHVRLVDATGRTIVKRTLQTGDRAIDIDGSMTPGLYFLELIDRDGSSLSRQSLIAQ